MGNQRAVLVVRTQPLRAADKEVLAHERPLDAVGIGRRAAGSQIAAPAALNAPAPGEPVGAGDIEAAQVRALQQRRAGLHVVVGHSHRQVVAVVVAHIGQRIDGNISGTGRRCGALILGLAQGTQSQHGNGGNERG